ncbi:MAG TPA: hypothetical protein VGV61_08655 [Thermoanaerobaculia bacterium]|jgi:hypothetical protein|nr:hypothetical protein [Thermoanaerobaculia bacterium]
MEDADRSRPYAPWLWSLLALFALRVLGQVLVAFAGVRFLPPTEQWMSGLLPYRWLLPSQLLILVLLGKVAADFSRGRGLFVAPRRSFARVAPGLGWLYLGSMVVRYVASMSIHPERRWFGQTIPIAFHCVLATFVILFGRYHREAFAPGGRAPLRVRKVARAAGGLLLLVTLLLGVAGCTAARRRHRAAMLNAPCTVSSELLGSWRGQPWTQLDPGSFHYRFECNSRYVLSAQPPKGAR